MGYFDGLSKEALTEAVRQLVAGFYGGMEYENMVLGDKYYSTKNKGIMGRKHYVYAEHEGVPILVEDVYKANNKLPSAFFRIQVDQKINYSIGQPVRYEADDVAALTEVLGRGFSRTLTRVAKSAAKKAVGWAQVNVNNAGKFEVVYIPAEQVIPYRDMTTDELQFVLRRYDVQVVNSEGTAIKTPQIEIWDKLQVSVYTENPETKFLELARGDNMINPRPHFFTKTVYGEATAETLGRSWGAVPFIPLYNNDEGMSDLDPIRAYVDAYDIVQSDFANNLEDFQDVYWILKGYQGTNLNEFLSQVKQYKALKIPSTGDAHAETINIPHEARKVALQSLETAIYKFGMAVDPSMMGGGSLTNVHIKAMFANLDLKAAGFEVQIRDFIERVCDFVNVYLVAIGNKPVELYDVIFDRSLIINEAEMLAANAGQMGAISEETRLSNHPWVRDSEDEMEIMQAESTIRIVSNYEAGGEEGGGGDGV